MRFELVSFVLVASIAPARGGAHASAAAPTTSSLTLVAPSSSSSVTLTGRVTEAPPTPSTGIDGAVVTIGDGPNAGRSAVTNLYGFYTIPDLTPGVFLIAASADGFVGTKQGIAVSENTTTNFQLLPTMATMTHVLTGDIGPNDGTCSDGRAQRPCRIVTIPIHNAGPVDAVLSWTGGAADLDLTLFQSGFSAPLARAAAVNGGPEEITARLTVGATYEFRITYAAGAARVAYTLRVSHPN